MTDEEIIDYVCKMTRAHLHELQVCPLFLQAEKEKLKISTTVYFTMPAGALTVSVNEPTIFPRQDGTCEYEPFVPFETEVPYKLAKDADALTAHMRKTLDLKNIRKLLI